MANVKRKKCKRRRNFWNHYCSVYFVGWLIWNFIMGNGANFEGGVTGHHQEIC
jgi:biopolymer transport protein ExbB